MIRNKIHDLYFVTFSMVPQILIIGLNPHESSLFIY